MEVFIDASVGKNKQSVGCFLIKGEDEINTITLIATSSTLAELELAYCVLSKYGRKGITLYSDCTNLISLPTRTYKTTHPHAWFYDLIKTLLIEYEVRLVKVKGHRKREAREHDYEEYFSLVDKASRKKLRS